MIPLGLYTLYSVLYYFQSRRPVKGTPEYVVSAEKAKQRKKAKKEKEKEKDGNQPKVKRKRQQHTEPHNAQPSQDTPKRRSRRVAGHCVTDEQIAGPSRVTRKSSCKDKQLVYEDDSNDSQEADSQRRSTQSSGRTGGNTPSPHEIAGPTRVSRKSSRNVDHKISSERMGGNTPDQLSPTTRSRKKTRTPCYRESSASEEAVPRKKAKQADPNYSSSSESEIDCADISSCAQKSCSNKNTPVKKRNNNTPVKQRNKNTPVKQRNKNTPVKQRKRYHQSSSSERDQMSNYSTPKRTVTPRKRKTPRKTPSKAETVIAEKQLDFRSPHYIPVRYDTTTDIPTDGKYIFYYHNENKFNFFI